jgi:hypothetical protein
VQAPVRDTSFISFSLPLASSEGSSLSRTDVETVSHAAGSRQARTERGA